MDISGKNFKVYRSSAGSGKTFTLVKEYLAMALRRPDQFRNVIAITFTNKAANEMKERVLQYLVALAEPDRHEDSVAIRFLLPTLAEEMGYPEDKVTERAAGLLHRIMHDYSDYSIGTIDSFIHRIIRTFSYDLKKPFDFEVEMKPDEVLEQVVDLVIDRSGRDVELTGLLVDFIEKKINEEKSWKIERQLTDFARVLLDEESRDFIGRLRSLEIVDFKKIRSMIEAFREDFETFLKGLGEEAMTQIRGKGLEQNDFFNKSRGVSKYFEKLAEGNTGNIRPGSTVENIIATRDSWAADDAPAVAREAIASIQAELKKIYNSVIERIKRDYARYQLYGQIGYNLYPMALLNEIEKELLAFNAENKLVLISEFNRIIFEVIRKQPVPFIYERVGERYHHYLIDEFQDTSVMQWHNLLPLVENTLSQDRLNMIVGDGKQAIYRWRSGDVEQFEKLPELVDAGDEPVLKDREAVLIRNYDQKQLTANFRSSPVIVHFNNSFFTRIREYIPGELRNIYQDVEQNPARKDLPGVVRIDTIDRKARREDYREFVFQRVLEMIQEIIQDGYRYKDISILLRDNKKASELAAWMLDRGISVVSSESLLLKYSDKISFLIFWLRHLSDPGDEVALAGIVDFLIYSGIIPHKAFHEVYHEVTMNGPEQYSISLERIIRQYISEFRFASLKRMELTGLVEEIIRIFGLNEPADPYVQFFQDAVYEYARKNWLLIEDFLDWWEQTGQDISIIVPEGLDAVSIMTVHKAKGLEFPVVIHPFADESKRKTREKKWVGYPDPDIPNLPAVYLNISKGLEETKFESILTDEDEKSLVDRTNLLYVAMTRPKERLYVITCLPSGKGTDKPSTYSEFFADYLSWTGEWTGDERSYIIGNRAEKRKAMEEERHEFMIDKYVSNKWQRQIRLRLQAPVIWEPDGTEDQRDWGNIVHLALAGVRYPNDVPRVISEMLLQGIMSENDSRRLTDVIDKMLDDPAFRFIFDRSYDVLNENEIIDGNGFLHRPDRLMVRGKEAVVIDYKTGSESPRHKKQLTEYSGLLREMDYEIKGAYLVYLSDNPYLVRVS